MIITRFCPYCNLEFTPRRTNQYYCCPRHTINMASRNYYRKNPERGRERTRRWKAIRRGALT